MPGCTWPADPISHAQQCQVSWHTVPAMPSCAKAAGGPRSAWLAEPVLLLPVMFWVRLLHSSASTNPLILPIQTYYSNVEHLTFYIC